MSLDHSNLENVVVFPGKDYRPDLETKDDPLEALLHEFDHVEDSEGDGYDDDDLWEDLADKEDNVGETTVEMVLMDLFKKEQTVTQMLGHLQELQNRQAYFMKEIEAFLPNRPKRS